MDTSFIERLFHLEAQAWRTYYVADGIEHGAVIAEIDRMCPVPGLDLMVYRREGPLDDVELSIASRNYKIEERHAFMTEFYEVDDRTQFLAVYTTSRNPLDVLFTLNELLWFKAVDGVVVELLAHAGVDVSKPDHLREWTYMAGEAPLDQQVLAPTRTVRGERMPMDAWGQGICAVRS